MIKKIRVTNFKSFKELEVELGKFNVLIGANASGKSNFVQIFKFLKDIVSLGLDNAVSLQGGAEYFRNLNISASENFSIKIVLEYRDRLSFGKRTMEGIMWMDLYEIIYEFTLKFKKRGGGFEVSEEKLTYKCKFVISEKLKQSRSKIKQREFIFYNGRNPKEKTKEIGPGEIIFSRANGNVKIDLHKPQGVLIDKDDIYPSFLKEKLRTRMLLIEMPFYFMPQLNKILRGVSIYDFDPKLSKKATPITGRVELEEDGSNLAIILKNITENKDERRKLFNLVKDLLPFISNLGIEKFAGKSLLFKLEEIYFKNQYLPAYLISDGTINITALIIALYFEKKPLTIIEEPERNIHPHLMSKVVDMMKDASQNKQIIVTTHNPEILKHAGLDNILFISRNEEGYSTITRPGDKEEIKKLLENQIGIEELYVQNLLI